MENVLKARIEADISGLKAGLAETEKRLKRAQAVFESSSKSVFQLENQVAKLSAKYKEGAISEAVFTKRTEELTKALFDQRANVKASQSEINRLNNLYKANQAQALVAGNRAAGQSVKSLTGNIRGANSVALEFNRIVQDAPFGLIGVGNNIQQLAGNFSNLSKSAGGTVPAIKAAFSALLTGPNVALLAISALTAGFTAYQMGAFNFAKSTKDAAEEAEKFAEDLDKFKKSLDAVAAAQLEGAQNAQKEITNFKLLRTQAENANLPLEKRLEAVNELKRLYPDYLGSLSNEQVLTGQVGEAYQKLTTNLLESAKARAAASRIAENSSTALEIELRANERVNQIIELQNQLREKQARLAEVTGGRSQVGVQAEQLKVIQEIARIEDNINKLRNEQVSDIQEIGKLSEENIGLQDRVNQSIESGGSLIKATKDGVNGLKDALNEIEPLDLKIGDLAGRIKQAYTNALNELDNEGIVNVPIKVDIPESEYDKTILDANQRIIENAKATEKVISDTGIQISNSFANAFAQGLDSGENFFDALQKGFSALLKQLAAQLAAAAFLRVLAGLASGGVATAFSGALSANPFGFLFRAGGGQVTKDRPYIVGESGRELFTPQTSGTITPLSSMATNPSPVFANSSGSGNQVVQVYGEIRNDTIVLANKRGERKNGRMYGIR